MRACWGTSSATTCITWNNRPIAGLSTLLSGPRDDLATKRIDGIDPNKIVRRRYLPDDGRIISRMTLLENLRVSAFTRQRQRGWRRHRMVHNYFPRLKERTDLAGYLSGDEQQMLAIDRALMAGRR
jgi:ABC-type branched-subunit amino acid transport system ATPase component